MLDFLNIFRGTELNTLSVSIRLLLAVVCGGLIGLERERKHRPAGFRTHILICLGAAMTTLTGQYLVLELHLGTDMARLGAQVIAGVGFIGAGTIIITKRRQVKGLTTAAGLWTSAIVGLCAGAGFFEGAIIATILVLLAELVFVKLEHYIFSNSRSFNVFVEYTSGEKLGIIVDAIKKNGAYIADIEVSKNSSEGRNPCAVLSLRTPRRLSHDSVMTLIAKLDGVVSVEEL
ncbi:MAG: MgtC/SapB family protein [Clostridia bacterium]|jgi:putative Mg2+ transporter-C (MgtC) family protein|nr:MgtC/SapB family protein [Clostridia bacterium]